MLVLVLFSSFAQPMIKRHVLAYATSMSSDALLSATNTQRDQNGVASLNINGDLTAAAQAKANDMVKRNYWSHNTPDGQEPWVFIQATGYKYTKAGENLAYGFDNSGDTVTGWMNSASHRENLLDSAFTDVGFGYANSDDFNNSGPETVVVAMYGKPQVLAATQTTAPTAAKPVQSPPAAAPTPTPQTETPKAQPVSSDQPVREPATQQIARVQNLSNGRAPWTALAATVLTGLAIGAMLIKYSTRIRHLLRDSEKFVLHHPAWDSLLVSLVLLGIFLSQTSGFIRWTLVIAVWRVLYRQLLSVALDQVRSQSY